MPVRSMRVSPRLRRRNSAPAAPTGGSDLAQALEQVTLAMFGYMTELGTVEPDPALDWEVTASGKDVLGLVFHLLDEALFRFATDDLIACDVQVTRLVMPGSTSGACSGDAAGQYSVTLACRGERFSLAKHPQGTEVKAITYSNMQVHGLGGGDKQVDEGASSEGVHVYVIVDI